MKVHNLIRLLQEKAPSELACSWDNSGLLLGRKDKEVERALVVVDITREAAEHAIEGNFDLIISHHPVLFSPVRKITDETPFGEKLLRLLQHDICCYAMHTNYDSAEAGMAALAAGRIGMIHPAVLDSGEADGCGADGGSCGIGRIGELDPPVTLEELCGRVKEAFQLPHLTVYGGAKNMQRQIRRVAVCPGSGADEIPLALKKGAEVYITGDLKHHQALDAVEEGLILLDGTHYHLEKIFLEDVASYLRACAPELTVETLQTDCFFYMD